MIHSVFEHMFQLPVPVLEKILRPIVVYLCLVGFLRVFGKRELAQLNPFDLVVLLTLSNTVQNAIIGEDNSVTGGIVGVLSLLLVNWLLTRLMFRIPKLDRALQGRKTVLVQHGRVNHAAMNQESLTEMELISVLHKQGYHDVRQVERCELEPNGTFYVEGKSPALSNLQHEELMKAVEKLTHEVRRLRAEKG